jgi:hypothetical protein
VEHREITRSDIEQLRRTSRRALDLSAADQRARYLPDGVGRAASTALGHAVRAMMLGQEEAARAVVERSHAWLIDSVARGEVVGEPPAYPAMLRSQALALATWLVRGVSDARIFADAVRQHRQALRDLERAGETSADTLVQGYLPDLVRDCFSAGAYELGERIYTRHLGPPPQDPAQVDTPLQLAGWLCREVGHLRPPAAWVAVGSRVLGQFLLDWLDVGQGLRAALWVKVVYADSGAALTPADALRRGGELTGVLPSDPLAEVMLDSLGDPVDMELLGGFLAAVGTAAGGRTVTAEFEDHEPLRLPVVEPEVTTGLDDAIAAAVAADRPGSLAERLTEAARGRVVDVDGRTPLTLRRIAIG